MYSIQWTDHALDELQNCYLYLQENWTDKQITKLSQAIDETITQICQNPRLYPIAILEKNYHLPVHKVTIQRYNTLYYAINEQSGELEVLSFFSNRQNPHKLQF